MFSVLWLDVLFCFQVLPVCSELCVVLDCMLMFCWDLVCVVFWITFVNLDSAADWLGVARFLLWFRAWWVAFGVSVLDFICVVVCWLCAFVCGF